MAAVLGRVFIYGGKGALGAACVTHFKAKNWWVGSIDIRPNELADANILVKNDETWLEQEKSVVSEAGKVLDGQKVDAVICVAGGWAGGNAASEDLVKNADLMWRQTVWSSTIAAVLAAKYLKEEGFISLPGANAAVGPTPGMVGYGMAKAAVHQLTQSLAGKDSGLPAKSLSVAILPITLDTPMNRKWMPNADFSTWTPLEFIADLFWKWSRNEDRPANGSLVSLVTKDSKTELVVV